MLATFFIVILFVWIIVLQSKIINISITVNEIKKYFEENNYSPQNKEIQNATAQGENKSVFVQQTENQQNIEDQIAQNLFANETLEDTKETVQPQIVQPVEKQTFSFEKLFLGNIFNKIGALAILIGIVILIKIVSPYLIFTPVVKISLSYLAGSVMIIGAFMLHSKENMQKYSEVLLGTGFGAMFISTYCASALFKLYTMPVTCIIATLFLLAAFYLADKLKTVSMLIISLIAAYINPLFLNSQYDVSQNFIFGYLIFVNLLSIAYTCRNRRNNILNCTNLFITLILATIFCYEASIIAPVILWGLYTVYDLISHNDKLPNTALNYWNFAVFTILLMLCADFKSDLTGYILLAIVFVYALIAYLKKSDEKIWKNYMHLGLISAYLCVCFLCKGMPEKRCFIWTLETIILTYYGYKYKNKALCAWATGILISAFTSMLPADGVFYIENIKDYIPFKNVRFLLFSPVIVSSALSGYILSKTEDETIEKFAHFFRFMCLSSLFLYAGLEINSIVTKHFINSNNSADFINSMINIILGFAYAISLRYLNNVINSKFFIQAISIMTSIFSLLFLIGLAVHYKPLAAFIPLINLRTAAFAAGIGTMIVYKKWFNKQIFSYISIFLGFLFTHYEIADTVKKCFFNGGGEYLISVCWILFSGIVTTLGIFKNKNYLKNSGICLCILSIIRIFIYDLAHIDILYKLIAFLTLGIILMVLSFLYNRNMTTK